MSIRYICWNYGRDNGYYRRTLHLIRWTNGKATLHTTPDMKKRGLCH